MHPAPPRLLVEGPPRAGKTTVIRRLIERLHADGLDVAGFVTGELVEHGQRVGFAVQAIGGPQATLAHVGFTSGPRVGRYRVDLQAFERVALPAITRGRDRGAILVIDEVGRMELASDRFVAVLDEQLTIAQPLVATVHAHAHPVTDALKAHPEVQRFTVTAANRDGLPALLSGLLRRRD